MRAAALVLAFVCVVAPAATASEPKAVTLGGIEIAYDAQRWHVGASGADQLVLNPVDPLGKTYLSVHVSTAEGAFDACPALAAEHLARRKHSVAASAPTTVAGLPAARAEGHSGCRNATPHGAAVCLHTSGRNYVFVAAVSSCRSGINPFVGTDFLGELLGGVRLRP